MSIKSSGECYLFNQFPETSCRLDSSIIRRIFAAQLIYFCITMRSVNVHSSISLRSLNSPGLATPIAK